MGQFQHPGASNSGQAQQQMCGASDIQMQGTQWMQSAVTGITGGFNGHDLGVNGPGVGNRPQVPAQPVMQQTNWSGPNNQQAMNGQFPMQVQPQPQPQQMADGGGVPRGPTLQPYQMADGGGIPRGPTLQPYQAHGGGWNGGDGAWTGNGGHGGGDRQLSAFTKLFETKVADEKANQYDGVHGGTMWFKQTKQYFIGQAADCIPLLHWAEMHGETAITPHEVQWLA